MRARGRATGAHGQRGSILPFFAIGMLAIVGVAGLAIDSSNAFVNVTRLQNALDAAALSAGKTVNRSGGDTARASLHGAETFAQHLDGGVGAIQVSFQYSDTLTPFTPGGTDPRYVRATANGFQVPIFLARVLPGVADRFAIGSTAVSGPIPLGGGEVCDIAPLLVCAPSVTDDDPDDDTLFGLPVGDDSPQRCLKQASHDGGNGGGGPGKDKDKGNGGSDPCGTGDPDANTLEAGNFYLSRVNCPGGACVREALAGGYEGCSTVSGGLDTEPGNTVGPTYQGLNTRFGIYAGGNVNEIEHPADFVVTSPMSYTDYKSAYANNAAYSGDSPKAFRRILAVPIADCTGLQNGLSTVNVLSLGCFFINELVDKGGPNSFILGQLIDQCEADGTPGPAPQTEGGSYQTYEIVLYNDPDNPAS